MNLIEKLQHIQTNLKAPKGQFNSFGKYHYRSCENILEGLKPLLAETKVALKISDNIEQIGDRYYIKATVKLMDCESEQVISNTALAREELSKKGMDGSQITGTASSYARKYALNGMFAIDDTKDADTQDNRSNNPTSTELKALEKLIVRKGHEVAKAITKPLNSLTREQYDIAVQRFNGMKDKVQ